MEPHARLAPSSAPIWGNCSGSVLAQAVTPARESAAAREGTAAHWVISECLAAGKTQCDSYLNLLAPNDVLIDDIILEGAQVMIDEVEAVCGAFSCRDRLLIEHRVHMPQIHSENWGTLDAAVYLSNANKLFIWDYKHGHRDCPPKENLQLINYLAGLVELYSLNYPDLQVSFRIVQPFCYHADGPVKEWLVKLRDLGPYFDRLKTKALEAFSAPRLTSGLWCRDCKVISKCPAVRKRHYNLIDVINDPCIMDEMDSTDLEIERDILLEGAATLRARLDAIEDELFYRIKQGENCGLALEAKNGRETWAIPLDQAKALFKTFGVDISKDGVLTPKQSVSKLPTSMRNSVRKFLSEFTKKDVSLKLVKREDSLNCAAFKPKK